ncbi:hypothetical protein CerSpe_070960 [Prunus speciosa]
MAPTATAPDAYNSETFDVILGKVPDDFKSLHEIPEEYAWTNLNEHPSLDSDSVPIIDLNDPNASQLISHACRTWGVFQLINHGVPDNVVEDMESVAQSLFSLPAEQKLKVARGPGGISAYLCFALTNVLIFFFSSITEEYEKELGRLSSRLTWIMLASLGVSKEDVKWSGPKGDNQEAHVLQLNSYPACPHPDRAMGLVPHTDSTLVSIIHQSKICGLQVQEGTGWFRVPPVPGAMVVNVGDLMHILSNGSYVSVLHRVLVNQTQHRLLVVYSYGPPDHVPNSPVPKLLRASHPALYPPVTNWSEYLDTKAKLKGKALASLQLYEPLTN